MIDYKQADLFLAQSLDHEAAAEHQVIQHLMMVMMVMMMMVAMTMMVMVMKMMKTLIKMMMCRFY